MGLFLSVGPGVSSLQVVDPRVDGRAGALAGGELPLVAPEAEAALGLPPSASGRPVLEVAAEHFGVVDGGQGLGVAGELNQLLAGDKVDVGQAQDGVHEVEESLDAVRPVVEPGGVEEEGKGSLKGKRSLFLGTFLVFFWQLLHTSTMSQTITDIHGSSQIFLVLELV